MYAAMAVGLILTACSSGRDIDGIWLLETIAIPEEGDVVVHAGTDADTTPWIRLTPTVEGHGGCNTLNQAGEPSATWNGEHLSTVRFVQTARGCLEPTRTIEEAFTNTLRHPGGIDVIFTEDGNSMIWESPTGVVVTLSRDR